MRLQRRLFTLIKMHTTKNHLYYHKKNYLRLAHLLFSRAVLHQQIIQIHFFPGSPARIPDMAPTRARKRKSTESSSADIPSFQTRSELVPTKTASPAITPTNRSPIRKRKMGITSRQKQALIDNLQLESTCLSNCYQRDSVTDRV